MSTQYSGPYLPHPSDTINLSLDEARIKEDLFRFEKRDARVAIRDYRHLVRCKMFAQEFGNVTPWGIWENPKRGFYEMKSSLNNRFLDTELAAPFLPVNVLEAVYPRMKYEGGITVEESIPARQEVRRIGRDHLMSAIYKRGGNRGSTHPLIRVRIVPQNRFDLLDYSLSNADRELAFGCNEEALISNHLIRNRAGHQARVIRHSCSEAELGNKWLDLSCDAIMPSEVTDYGENRQHFFIDLRTLALMSANFPIGHKVLERAWLFWSIMASLSGLPCAVLSPHGHMDPQHPLSPCNLRFDPIFAVLYGMWSLGAADNFRIALSLDHPIRSLRGAYLTFQLGGPGNKKILSVLKGESTHEQLEHPTLGEKEAKKPEPVKGVLDAFEEGKKEGSKW